MDKKKIIAICSIAAVVLIAVVIAIGTVLKSGSVGIDSPSETGTMQNANNAGVVSNGNAGGYFLDDVNVSGTDNGNAERNSQENGAGSTSSNDSTASMSPTPSDGQSSTVQETVDEEKRASAENMVSNAFSNNGSFSSMSVTTLDEIPQALRNEDNWVYMVAMGTDLAALLGGSSRENVQVLDTKLSSNSPSGALYSVTYRFTAVPRTAMDASGSMQGTGGQVTALVRVDNTGKVVQYSENRPEWL